MQVHQITSTNDKVKKRVGRGGKRGTYSGRGIKGQKARSGRRVRPQMRDTLKKIPKRRGQLRRVWNRVSESSSAVAVINLNTLERKFENNAEISPKILFERGLISKISGKYPVVKILGTGKITKSFIFKDCGFSKTAREAVEKSGGRILAKK